MQGFRQYKKYFIIIITLILLTIFGILFSIRELSRGQVELSRETIKFQVISLFETIVLFRGWSAEHGGVYVKQEGSLKPNPYLENNQIKSESGDIFIRINPAWMTRQVLEYANLHNTENHYYKITSLNPKNPENKPDNFETKALTYFSQHKGEKYFFEFSTENPSLLHFMGALYMEASCIPCHKGDIVGDVRGGIRITVPIDQFRKKEEDIQQHETRIIILILALVGWASVFTLILFRIIFQHQNKISFMNKNLQNRVIKRTKKINDLYEKEKYLHEIMNIIASVNKQIISMHSMETLIDQICTILISHRQIDYVWIYLKNNSHPYRHYHSPDDNQTILNTFISRKGKSESIFYPALKCIKKSEKIVINDLLLDYEVTHWLDKIRQTGFRSSASFPLKAKGNKFSFGSISVFSREKNSFAEQEIAMLLELSGDLGFAIDAFQKRRDIARMKQEKIKNYDETIFSFIQLVEERDSYTAGHSVRVARYATIVATEMGLKKHQIEMLGQAAILHDLGKIGTPDSILLRPGKLSDLEFDLVKLHVLSGYNVLSKVNLYKDLSEIIKYHHERHDGRGYPSGVSGENIPLLSQILSVADAFDAMTTDRVYHDRLLKKDAIAEIKKNSGTQFNPNVARYAANALSKIEIDAASRPFPESELDKKRFSFFFNDSLTELYNEAYFFIIMKNHAKLSAYRNVCFLSLKNFTAYNKNYGWDMGNELLIAFSNQLKSTFEGSLLFRVKGDDFIIISSYNATTIKNKVKNISLTREQMISIKTTVLSLKSSVVNNLNKKTLNEIF